MTVLAIRIFPDHRVTWMWHLLMHLLLQLATSSSKSLPNYGENSNQPKRLLFPNCDYGQWKDFYEVCIQFSTQQKWYSSIYIGRMVVLGKLVDSVSINPALSKIKLLRWFIVCQEVAMVPGVGTYYTNHIACVIMCYNHAINPELHSYIACSIATFSNYTLN